MIMMSGERPDYHYLLTHLTPHWQAWPFARLLLRHFTTDTSSVKPREIFILHNKRFSDETLHEMLPICAGKGWQVISSLKTSLKPSSTFWTPWTCKRSHIEEKSRPIYIYLYGQEDRLEMLPVSVYKLQRSHQNFAQVTCGRWDNQILELRPSAADISDLSQYCLMSTVGQHDSSQIEQVMG